MIANIWTWLVAHWELVCLVLYVLINICNAASRHWSEHKGVVRWCLFVAEVLSIVSSRGRTPAIKPPLDVDRHGPALLPFVLAASLLLGGCGVYAQLQRAHTAVEVADKIALDVFATKCMDAAKACKGRQPTECPGWVQCDGTRTKYLAAAKAIDDSLAVLNRLLRDMGVKP
jgi:hypothetical protein